MSGKNFFLYSLLLSFIINFFLYFIFENKSAIGQGAYCQPLPYLTFSGPWPGQGYLVMTSSTPNVLVRYAGTGAGIVSGSGSPGQIAFWSGSSILSGDNNLFWDNTNKRLGIGTTTPQTALHVIGDITATNFIGNYAGTISSANVSSGVFGSLTGGGNFSFPAFLGISTSSQINLPQPLSVYGNAYIEGNLGIGTTTPTAKLQLITSDTLTSPFEIKASASSSFSTLLSLRYRRPITINNTSNSNNLSFFQVLVTIDTASLISTGKMRSDCGDIRFVDSDETTLLGYWIESGCNTASTRIWVNIPFIPANSTKTIYVYYGNPSLTSMSSPMRTFTPNIIEVFSGSCSDSTNCYFMDNHTEADAIRNYPANICIKYVNGIYWGSVCDNSSPGSSVRDNFYSRFRFLFVPDVSGTWYFAVDSDDGSELVKSNADMYGGIHEHTVIASWYGGHGWCNCQSYSGSIYLTAGQGIWLDYIQQDWGGGEAAVVWVRRPGDTWRNLSINNFPNQIFSRGYTSPEPTTSIESEENLMVSSNSLSVLYIQPQTGNIGIKTSNPQASLDILGRVKNRNTRTQIIDTFHICNGGSTSWGDFPGMSLNIETGDQTVFILAHIGGVYNTDTANGYAYFRLLVDGNVVFTTAQRPYGNSITLLMPWVGTLRNGFHEIKVQWRTNTGVICAGGDSQNRSLIVIEL